MFEFLQSALAERDPYLTRMDAEPYFEPFRSDQRYRTCWMGCISIARHFSLIHPRSLFSQHA
jgi:hypothetical protein